ncbi:MAG: hypothetical protein HYY14_00400 [Candidatus Omnitrophica bacterium]|nr:hypothetical protein [Candidatus Omnitrophota bacterium]
MTSLEAAQRLKRIAMVLQFERSDSIEIRHLLDGPLRGFSVTQGEGTLKIQAQEGPQFLLASGAGPAALFESGDVLNLGDGITLHVLSQRVARVPDGDGVRVPRGAEVEGVLKELRSRDREKIKNAIRKVLLWTETLSSGKVGKPLEKRSRELVEQLRRSMSKQTGDETTRMSQEALLALAERWRWGLGLFAHLRLEPNEIGLPALLDWEDFGRFLEAWGQIRMLPQFNELTLGARAVLRSYLLEGTSAEDSPSLLLEAGEGYMTYLAHLEALDRILGFPQASVDLAYPSDYQKDFRAAVGPAVAFSFGVGPHEMAPVEYSQRERQALIRLLPAYPSVLMHLIRQFVKQARIDAVRTIPVYHFALTPTEDIVPLALALFFHREWGPMAIPEGWIAEGDITFPGIRIRRQGMVDAFSGKKGSAAYLSLAVEPLDYVTYGGTKTERDFSRIGRAPYMRILQDVPTFLVASQTGFEDPLGKAFVQFRVGWYTLLRDIDYPALNNWVNSAMRGVRSEEFTRQHSLAFYQASQAMFDEITGMDPEEARSGHVDIENIPSGNEEFRIKLRALLDDTRQSVGEALFSDDRIHDRLGSYREARAPKNLSDNFAALVNALKGQVFRVPDESYEYRRTLAALKVLAPQKAADIQTALETVRQRQAGIQSPEDPGGLSAGDGVLAEVSKALLFEERIEPIRSTLERARSGEIGWRDAARRISEGAASLTTFHAVVAVGEGAASFIDQHVLEEKTLLRVALVPTEDIPGWNKAHPGWRAVHVNMVLSAERKVSVPKLLPILKEQYGVGNVGILFTLFDDAWIDLRDPHDPTAWDIQRFLTEIHAAQELLRTGTPTLDNYREFYRAAALTRVAA